jgi:hypothetical protein
MFPRHARILKVFLSICIVLSISLLIYSPVTRATSHPIQVDSRSNALTFPKAIDFKISAHDSSSSLTQATIYLTYKGFDYQRSHQVNATRAGSAYTFQWHDDLTTSGDQFPPVGTQVSYYWTITDAAGNSYTDPLQTVDIVDNRFNWQHLSKGFYQVNWYDRGTDFGQMVLGKVDTDIQSISHNLGGGLNHQINLWVYQSANDFQGSLPPNVHEWVGGIAFPSVSEASIVVQSADDDTLQRDMPHELTHLLFHQLIVPGVAPTWFDEGLAVYNQNYHESEMLVRFKTALNNHNLLPLNSIAQDFPADADKAYLAYAQSWQLVDYMYRAFGLQKMAALIHTMDTPNQGFDADMRQSFGLDVAHLENQWHLSLNQPPTLSKDQMLEPLPAPQPPPNPYDKRTIILLLLGVLLVVVALLGLSGIVSYQRRVRQMALLGYHVQYTPQSILAGQKWLRNWFPQIPPSNYTSPSAYRLPEQPRMPEQHVRRSEYPRFRSSSPSQRK